MSESCKEEDVVPGDEFTVVYSREMESTASGRFPLQVNQGKGEAAKCAANRGNGDVRKARLGGNVEREQL